MESTTDDSTFYIKFDEHVRSRLSVIANKQAIKTFLPLVHIAISNAKRLLLDVYHRLKAEYLQYYLHEFCYKSNRRYFGEKMLDRLVFATISYNTDFKSKIYNKTVSG